MEQIKDEYKFLNNNDILVTVSNTVPKNIQLFIFDIESLEGIIINQDVKLFRKCKYVDFYFNL